MGKPIYASSHDENHFLPRDYLKHRCGGFEDKKIGKTIAYTANFRGYKIVMVDLSAIGGVVPDWHIECPETQRWAWVEVKTEAAYKKENHDLTEGEMWTRDNSGSFEIVVTDEDFELLLYRLINKKEGEQ